MILYNATIINEGEAFKGSLIIDGMFINKIVRNPFPEELEEHPEIDRMNLEGKLLIPGLIDDQVHFREPGLTHKGDIASESRAAIAGGITSFMEMPNTKPAATTIELLEEKFNRAKEVSAANYSFYLGATNNNIEEITQIDPQRVCGVKVFMGSSTGNMLVDEEKVLEDIFSKSPVLIATHCEDEETIAQNTARYKKEYGEDAPVELHPKVRSAEACYKSSSYAVRLAKKFGSRLHVLHLSTEKEIDLFKTDLPLEEKRITGEVCVHHLWFNSQDYKPHGARIKWNPAVKEESDRKALLQAVKEGSLDVIATDHAPHTLGEKEGGCFQAASGGPLVQQALQVMLELHKKQEITLEQIVSLMCHNPAIVYQVKQRGFIREGYYADLVIVDLNQDQEVKDNQVLYKCGWSPFSGNVFTSTVSKTFLNGKCVYSDGQIINSPKGMELEFNR